MSSQSSSSKSEDLDDAATETAGKTKGKDDGEKKACDAMSNQSSSIKSDRIDAKEIGKKKGKDDRAKPPFPLFPSEKSETLSFSQGLASVANLLRGRKNIVVLTGAGISTSCGLPDFRSKNVGLYDTLDTEALGLSCPEELFDLSFFQEDPLPFYKFARRLYFPTGSRKERVRPSDSHKLLALLEKKNMLLRVYSQNIDGLEQDAGVSPKRIVYAHGSLQWATCQQCKRKVGLSEIEEDIWTGQVARCTAETKEAQTVNGTSVSDLNGSIPMRSNSLRLARKRSRETDDATTMRTRGTTRKENRCGGLMKPGVTFFGECLGDKVRRSLEADRKKVDALIVIGTSLSVAPISKVIDFFPPNIPRILINRTIVRPVPLDLEEEEHENSDFRSGYDFDAYLLGFCDDVTRALAKELLLSSPSTSSHIPKSSPDERVEGRVLLSLKGDELANDCFSFRDWSTVQVPHDRVFLFPGAQHSIQHDDASDMTYYEVAHCDGCSKRIEGPIRKCLSCFDFDLCSQCYPSLSKKHFDGKHRFTTETARPLVKSKAFP